MATIQAVGRPGGRSAREPAEAPWIRVGLIGLALAGIVVVRWSASRAGLDPLAVGAVFGLALLALAAVARPVTSPIGLDVRTARSLFIAAVPGLAVGLLLVGLTMAAPAVAGLPRVEGLARPAAPFLPWAIVTIVVAAAEEAILRGAMFGAVRRVGGAATALAVTTAVFALIHVPLYGWHVVPLDLAVGVALGGLRIVTRGIAAPAIAHAVADLATWWL